MCTDGFGYSVACFLIGDVVDPFTVKLLLLICCLKIRLLKREIKICWKLAQRVKRKADSRHPNTLDLFVALSLMSNQSTEVNDIMLHSRKPCSVGKSGLLRQLMKRGRRYE